MFYRRMPSLLHVLARAEAKRANIEPPVNPFETPALPHPLR